jgi:predicted RNA-binding Zn-ribbon protein involved in translation (DUF1610 family)
MNKSRPVYQPLRIDASGSRHLVVTDAASLDEKIAGEDIEIWTIEVAAPGIPAPPKPGERAFLSVPHMLSHLKHRLARETVGFRLYAAGTEAFLWDVMNIATAAGLGKGEVFLSHAGSLKRRVYCTHCKAMIEDVTRNIVPCPGCGANLAVRDHFSRRLAAFMGVKADAEAPGEIPVAEEVYP